MSYQKLVRDNIPDLIRAKGEKPIIRKLGIREYKLELRKKLKEEAFECAEAKGKEALIEELADIEEVLLALYDAEKIDRSLVIKSSSKKRKIRGGFKKRIFLSGVKK